MTPSTASNLGYNAVAMTQEERWKTVRSCVTVKEVETSVRLMGRVKAPTRTRGTHFSAREMGQYPKARKTGPLPLCLSLDTSQECRDYKRVVDKSWP